MTDSVYILGISAYYHDSAAALIKNGEVIAAAQEERFTRKKHDPAFPSESVKYCLREAGITLADVKLVTFYEKPFLKFERLLETYISFAPKGLLSFWSSMPTWLKSKLFQKREINNSLIAIDAAWKGRESDLLFSEHHLSHAASAFYPSPFEKAIVLTADGVGEWSTTTIGLGDGNQLNLDREIAFPHSLGLLYSAFTYYCGFKVNSGEYKLMGLAPYGQRGTYTKIIYENLIDLKEDGSFHLNLKYFDYCVGNRMISRKFEKLFGGSARKPESPISQKEMNIAASIQEVTEEVMLRLCRDAKMKYKVDNLCLAGGVALNCVSNGRISRKLGFKKIWIQPAAGDAGGALGAALLTWYQFMDGARLPDSMDSMKGSLLGPKSSESEILNSLSDFGLVYEKLSETEIVERTAQHLAREKVVGWHSGRMEFGPRALGGRSILADARSEKMQKNLNLKIKFRESFRPFAPIVLEEFASEYFEMTQDSPYMLIVSGVKKDKLLNLPSDHDGTKGFGLLNYRRSEIPAVTHVDNSARVQTVNKLRAPRLHQLLSKFREKTGSAVLVNTSFNIRGEPIVCTPADSINCFVNTDMDVLVMDNFILEKDKQEKLTRSADYLESFELD